MISWWSVNINILPHTLGGKPNDHPDLNWAENGDCWTERFGSTLKVILCKPEHTTIKDMFTTEMNILKMTIFMKNRQHHIELRQQSVYL